METKIRTDGNGTGRSEGSDVCDESIDGRAGRGRVALFNFIVRQSVYLHSALGTRPVRHDRPSRAQLSGRFGDADGDVASAVIQGLLTTRSRRFGHMHAPPTAPTAQEREKKILTAKKRESETMTDGHARARPRVPLDRHRPSLASRGTRATDASPPRCALEPTLDEYASVLEVRKRGTEKGDIVVPPRAPAHVIGEKRSWSPYSAECAPVR